VTVGQGLHYYKMAGGTAYSAFNALAIRMASQHMSGNYPQCRAALLRLG
jgi:hypothetical protein